MLYWVVYYSFAMIFRTRCTNHTLFSVGLTIVDGCMSDGCASIPNPSTRSFANFSCVMVVSGSMMPVMKLLSVIELRISYASSKVAVRFGSINNCPLV